MKNTISFEAFLIFLLGLAIFSSGLFNHEFIQFESRFGLFAQEMLRNGVSFFPTTYNKFYPDYPATQTILTYLFSLPFGKVTILTAVLPTALASALTLMFIYLIGVTQSKRWGIYAVLFTLFTYNFLAAARTISLDQFTTTATVICFYCVYSATLYQKPQRLWFVPLIWILSFAFRGPIGLIIPATIVGSYYLIAKDWRQFAIMAISAVILLSLCMGGLIAAAWYEGGHALITLVLHMQATHRLASAESVPFYYYFTASFVYYALSFPVAIVIFAVYCKKFFQPQPNSAIILLRYLAVWLFILLIGMSIPSDEKMRYILPITPAITLSAAYLYCSQPSKSLLIYLRMIINGICASLPFLGFIITAGCLVFSHYQKIPLLLAYPWLLILFGALSIATILLSKKIKGPERRELVIFIIGLSSFILLYVGIAQPLDVQFNRAKPFVETVETLRQANQQLVFYRIGPDGEDIKFMVALDKPVQPHFLQNPNELITFPAPALFIAKDDDFAALPPAIKTQMHVLYEGHLGHQDCVVFSKK